MRDTLYQSAKHLDTAVDNQTVEWAVKITSSRFWMYWKETVFSMKTTELTRRRRGSSEASMDQIEGVIIQESFRVYQLSLAFTTVRSCLLIRQTSTKAHQAGTSAGTAPLRCIPECRSTSRWGNVRTSIEDNLVATHLGFPDNTASFDQVA